MFHVKHGLCACRYALKPVRRLTCLAGLAEVVAAVAALVVAAVAEVVLEVVLEGLAVP